MSAFQRVALVNVRLESRQRIPVNLLVLAAYIKERTKVGVFDPDPERQQDWLEKQVEIATTPWQH